MSATNAASPELYEERSRFAIDIAKTLPGVMFRHEDVRVTTSSHGASTSPPSNRMANVFVLSTTAKRAPTLLPLLSSAAGSSGYCLVMLTRLQSSSFTGIVMVTERGARQLVEGVTIHEAVPKILNTLKIISNRFGDDEVVITEPAAGLRLFKTPACFTASFGDEPSIIRIPYPVVALNNPLRAAAEPIVFEEQGRVLTATRPRYGFGRERRLISITREGCNWKLHPRLLGFDVVKEGVLVGRKRRREWCTSDDPTDALVLLAVRAMDISHLVEAPPTAAFRLLVLDNL